ncbi:MAG: polyprenyl synthetase family protein [Spirochaetota bacterium]|nr:polyprenyl synthetase family protein [Spirochaetota bacterium]
MLKTDKVTLQDIVDPINCYLCKVDEEIKNKLKTGISILDESALHLFKRGGKKIRASLIIIASGLKNNIPDDIIEVAAAAEIVHGATLIHDDIIDEANYRRGEVTVSRKWGNKVAVLVGDFMYTRGLDVAVGEDRIDLFPVMVSAALDMVKGELYQIEYSDIDLINKEHYYNIIDLKTARFMATCAKLGAVKAKMSDIESNILYNFGLNMGYAFQIVDDAIDFLNDKKCPEKDTGGDFLSGKITLPFLRLLEISNEEERAYYTDIAKNPDSEGYKIIQQKIMSCGAIDYCRGVAKEYISIALKHLDYFPFTIYKEVMINLSNFFIERNY